MGKSRAPDPYVNCKVAAVSTKFRRCEGLYVQGAHAGDAARCVREQRRRDGGRVPAAGRIPHRVIW